MTCVAGVIADGEVWLGADSHGGNGEDWMQHVVNPKVGRWGDRAIFGFTTSWRFGDLLTYEFELPEHPEGRDALEFMVRDVVPALQEVFVKGGYVRKDNERLSAGNMLIGYQGRLFEIQDEFAVLESLRYNAVGSGATVAMGAMAVLTRWLEPPMSMGPNEIIGRALQAAETHVPGIKGPHRIERLPRKVAS